MRSRITGVGFHVPERVVTNHDLAGLMDTSDEWIVERTGIRERRFVAPGIGSTDLAEHAALAAIADAGREVREIDFIVFATITRDYMFPGCASLLQHRLGLPTIGALEVHNACSGFVYALSVGDAFVRMGATSASWWWAPRCRAPGSISPPRAATWRCCSAMVRARCCSSRATTSTASFHGRSTAKATICP